MKKKELKVILSIVILAASFAVPPALPAAAEQTTVEQQKENETGQEADLQQEEKQVDAKSDDAKANVISAQEILSEEKDPEVTSQEVSGSEAIPDSSDQSDEEITTKGQNEEGLSGNDSVDSDDKREENDITEGRQTDLSTETEGNQNKESQTEETEAAGDATTEETSQEAAEIEKNTKNSLGEATEEIPEEVSEESTNEISEEAKAMKEEPDEFSTGEESDESILSDSNIDNYAGMLDNGISWYVGTRNDDVVMTIHSNNGGKIVVADGDETCTKWNTFKNEITRIEISGGITGWNVAGVHFTNLKSASADVQRSDFNTTEIDGVPIEFAYGSEDNIKMKSDVVVLNQIAQTVSINDLVELANSDGRENPNRKWLIYSSNSEVVKGVSSTSSGQDQLQAVGTGCAKVTVNAWEPRQTLTFWVVVSPEGSAFFAEINGADYWYESGVRQGTSSDPKGVWMDGTNRGREIYDPQTDSWYWLDADADGAKAVSKEVFVPYIIQGDGGSNGGKWVRYNSQGKMIKGYYPGSWEPTYYYDVTTGAMAKGMVSIDGVNHYFNPTTGVAEGAEITQNNRIYKFHSDSNGIPGTPYNLEWSEENGQYFWYENGCRKGCRLDDPSFRGEEIYDPNSGDWFWLDNNANGAKAVNKDVYMPYIYSGDKGVNGGKWVRYNEYGEMIKQWSKKNGKLNYFDTNTGAMAKGTNTVAGMTYTFNHGDGVLQPYAGGHFDTTDQNTILNRIKQIRYEACKEGVPYEGRNLTLSDYHPVTWDDGMSAIADVRAMEASTYPSLAHTRPDQTTCFTCHGNNEYSNGECLAWNMSSNGLMRGIDQWYSEKSTYLRKQEYDYDTGHYLNIISPAFDRIAVSCFYAPQKAVSCAMESSISY